MGDGVTEGAADHRRLGITDGLRAIAVLAVVLFHFFPTAFRGGYIGVDVFFVISGFVIALRYLPGLISGEKRIGDFFIRRIQRLLPAYLTLLIVVAACAYALLPPMALLKFGQSLMAQAAYLQNVFFWNQGEYFDKAAQKPLLHTWSLAVEEQFYLFFPLLVLIFRRNRRLAIGLLIAAFCASLALGWLVAGSSPKTAFYMLPTRVWEFFIGIAVALLFDRVRFGKAALPLYLGSIVLLLFAILGFDERDPFPGPQALIAVFATGLICWVQREVPRLPAALLTNRVAQHLGQISYSWYLWHWPLVVFFYAATGRLPHAAEGLAGVLASYLLAVASFRFIEQPALAWAALRKPRNALMLLGSFLGVALAAGLFMQLTQGALFRYAPDKQVLYAADMDRVPYRCPLVARLTLYDAEICRLVDGANGPPTLLIGDSHADRAKAALAPMAAASGTPFYLTKRNCRPTRFGKAGNCPRSVWTHIARDMKRFGIKRVVIVAYWTPDLTETDYREAMTRILDTGATVYVQKVAPNGSYFHPIRRAEGKTYPAVTLDDYNRAYAAQNQAFAALAARYGARFQVMDPVPHLCPDVCAFETGGKPNYMDDNHVNSVGLARISPIYAPIFRP